MIAMYIPEMIREDHPGHFTWTPPLGQMRILADYRLWSLFLAGDESLSGR
jgi:hypothetical protein